MGSPCALFYLVFTLSGHEPFFFALLAFDSFSSPVSTLDTDDNTYHIVRILDLESDRDIDIRYAVLKCGRLEWVCLEIYEAFLVGRPGIPGIDTINLLHDPQTNTVSLEVNGEIVLTEYP